MSASRFGLEGEKDVVVTNERHRGELERAEVHLAAFAETGETFPSLFILFIL